MLHTDVKIQKRPGWIAKGSHKKKKKINKIKKYLYKHKRWCSITFQIIWWDIFSCVRKTEILIIWSTTIEQLYWEKPPQKWVLPFTQSNEGSVQLWIGSVSWHYSLEGIEWQWAGLFHWNKYQISNTPNHHTRKKYWVLVKRKLMKFG